MQLLFAGLSGLLFGLGLLISGMADPAKVLGFLDIGGAWDPSLALVMLGAIAVTAPAYARLKRRGVTVTVGAPLQWPTARRIDRRLLSGAALFGVGWGLVGLCPGPAIVVAAQGYEEALTFVLAMLVGMGVFSIWSGPTHAARRADPVNHSDANPR